MFTHRDDRLGDVLIVELAQAQGGVEARAAFVAGLEFLEKGRKNLV